MSFKVECLIVKEDRLWGAIPKMIKWNNRYFVRRDAYEQAFVGMIVFCISFSVQGLGGFVLSNVINSIFGHLASNYYSAIVWITGFLSLFLLLLTVVIGLFLPMIGRFNPYWRKISSEQAFDELEKKGLHPAV